MLVLLLIIFRKRKRVRKIKLNARFFIHSSNIFIRSKDVYFAVEKPPIQLEKQTQKKERKKIFFLSKKRRRRVCASRFFFWTKRKKQTHRQEREEQKEEVLGVLFFKKEEKTTPSSIEEELNNARLKIEILRTIRSYSPHFRVPCILSSVFFRAFRWWEQSLWTFFFYIFFSFVFFPSCGLFFTPPTPTQKKILRAPHPPPSFFLFCRLAFVLLSCFCDKKKYIRYRGI